MLTFAIGDVHGCLKPLEALVQKCLDYAEGRAIKFVFLGDYVDRGPDSKAAIDFLMALSLNHACVFLRGNHEDMLMNDYQNFLHNGGVVTLKSYGWQDDVLDAHRVRSSIPKEHWDFFRNTVLHHRDALRTYVHAGIYRSLGGVENQSDRVKLWARHEFLEDPSMDGGYIVHGHTPMENGNVPMQKPNRINLDTGAAFGGRLTAAAFNELEVEPECILQVDSPRRLREVP